MNFNGSPGEHQSNHLNQECIYYLIKIFNSSKRMKTIQSSIKINVHNYNIDIKTYAGEFF